MKNRYFNLSLILITILVFGMYSVGAFAQSYKYTRVDYPDGDLNWNWTQFVHINDKGIISGGNLAKDKITFAAFLYDGNTFQTVSYPGSSWTRIGGINNKGEVAGWFRYPGIEMNHGFIMHGKNKRVEYTILDFPGAQYNFLYCLNENGLLTGTSELGGYIYDMKRGKYQLIEYPGAKHTRVSCINNNNIVSGSYSKGSSFEQKDYRGFLYNLKTSEFFDINLDEKAITSLGSLNDSSQVIATNWAGSTADLQTYVYDWKKNTFTPINYPNSIWTNTCSINNKGVVVGEFRDANGYHAFIAEPIAK